VSDSKMDPKRIGYLLDHFGEPGRWPSREDIEDAGKLLREQRNLIDSMLADRRDMKLHFRGHPHTEDGYPITTEMTLYRIEDDGTMHMFSARMEDPDGNDDFEGCYASEEAAEAAAAGGGA